MSLSDKICCNYDFYVWRKAIPIQPSDTWCPTRNLQKRPFSKYHLRSFTHLFIEQDEKQQKVPILSPCNFYFTFFEIAETFLITFHDLDVYPKLSVFQSFIYNIRYLLNVLFFVFLFDLQSNNSVSPHIIVKAPPTSVFRGCR